MDVARLACCGSPVLVALLPADEPPPTAVGDLAELLHVHVQHRPRMGVLVAADRLTAHSVQMRQPVQPAPHQHRMHRRRRHPGSAADRYRAEALLPPQVHDLAQHLAGGPVRLGPRPRRTVDHSRLPSVTVPVGPPLRGRPRHVIPFSGPSDRPALVNDQPGEFQTCTRGQCSVSVGHEGLLVSDWFLDSSNPPPEAFTHQQHSDRVVTPSQPTCLVSTPSAS